MDFFFNLIFIIFFFFKYKFTYFNWRLITLQYCIGFANGPFFCCLYSSVTACAHILCRITHNLDAILCSAFFFDLTSWHKHFLCCCKALLMIILNDCIEIKNWCSITHLMFPVIGHCNWFRFFGQFWGQCFIENLHLSGFIFLLGLLLMGSF